MNKIVIAGTSIMMTTVSLASAATIVAGNHGLSWSLHPVSIAILASGDGVEAASAVDLRVSIVGDSPGPLVAGFNLDVPGALFNDPPFHTAFVGPPDEEATGGAGDFGSPRVISNSDTVLAVVDIDLSSVGPDGGTWQWLLGNSVGSTILSGAATTALLDGTITVAPHPPLPNQWGIDGDGSWNVSGNWTHDTVPDAADEVANFLDKTTASRSVSVDSRVTVGAINFDNSNGYAITGPAGITLQATTGDAQITSRDGHHTVYAPLSVASDLTVNTEGASTVTLDPDTLAITRENLTKTGSGKLAIGNGLVFAGEVNVEGGDLEISNGVLAQPGGEITLAPRTNLLVSGPVNRHIIGASDSRIAAVDATTIGVAASTAGYEFGGILDVGEHLVGLVDYDQAKLRGAAMAGGTLSSLNGIEVGSFDAAGGGLATAIVGTGTINGNIQLSAPGELAAFVFGDVGTDGIVMTGVVNGNGNLFNVTITGLFRPGFSPTFSPVGGGTTIGATKFEIGGAEGGTVVNAGFGGLVVGDYTQLYAYGNFPGIPDDLPVLGPIQVELTGGYVPEAGSQFDVIVTGEFDFFGTVLNPANLVYGQGGSGNVLFDFNDAPLPDGMEWVVGMEPDGLRLTVVPEPGMLVLVGTGAMGLLLWRRKVK